MRLSYLLVAILSIISIGTDYFIYKRLVNGGHNKKVLLIHKLVSAITLCAIILIFAIPHRHTDNTLIVTKMWALYTFVSILLTKLIYLILSIPENKFMKITATVISLGIFVAMWWGAIINRFNIDVKKQDITIQNTIKDFDGYKIVQFSDLHLGTYCNDTSYVAELVKTINGLHPDLVVFTGDIVNRRTSELEPFVSTLSHIQAPDGVISILGNHDYGDYCDWNTDAEKIKNRERLIELNRIMGWTLLLDETKIIRHGSDSIAIIGVENIGDPPFPSYGSLKRAYKDVSDNTEKILLSHNPAHWCSDIRDNPDCNIFLTLSGHTHAMQMEIGGYSPSALKYKTWGGLYEDSENNKLYVNIGIGTVLFPARIGATPEITLFTLQTK